MDINLDKQDQKYNTLFVGIGTHPYDKLLSVIDNPLIYETLIKQNFQKIIFQCPHKDYFKPLFHKPYENQIKVEVYGIDFPSELFLYKSDVAITSCDVGVLLESNLVKINLIVVIEDTNSISYEIFSNLKEKPNVLGIKGAETLTCELGAHKIPGEEYRPKQSDEKFQRQLMLLKQSLTEQNDKYKNQDRHYATEEELVKNSMKLYLEYLSFAFDSKKLNLSLVRHPQFTHLEPLLLKNDLFTFQRDLFNEIKIEDDGIEFEEEHHSSRNGNLISDFSKKGVKQNALKNNKNINREDEDDDDAKSNNSFDSFNSNQVDNKKKTNNNKQNGQTENNEYTKPKEGENEEDYFLRIKKNYNPYFYLDNQNIFDEEDDEELQEFGDNGQKKPEADNKNNVNKLGKTIKKPKQSYLNKVTKNKKLYNLDFSNSDPLQILRNQDLMRAQEVHVKKIEKTNNEIDELMSSIEKKEVIQMIKDEYETKIIKGSYRICNCPYCKRLLVPFLIRKDFEDCHQEINDMVLNKHKLYFEKVKQRYQISDINIEYINNIFFREYKTNYISVTVEPDQQNNQQGSSSEENNDSPIKCRTNTSLNAKKSQSSKLPFSILRNKQNDIEVDLEEEEDEDEEMN